MAIILGIDPGSRITGYGIVHVSGSQSTHVTHGTIITGAGATSERLHKIYDGLIKIINQFQPQIAAIEQVFMHANVQAALKLGQARGAAMVALAGCGLEVHEYSAKQVKQAVVGYGAANKGQVQHMIKMLLKLSEYPAEDAADALAIALCHGNRHAMAQKIKQAIE